MLDLDAILPLGKGSIPIAFYSLLLLEPLLFGLFGLEICSSAPFEMISLYYEA
jgi:hypothetical protein